MQKYSKNTSSVWENRWFYLLSQHKRGCVCVFLKFSLSDKGKADKLLIKAKKSDVPAALALHTASTAGSAPFTW